MSVAAVVELSQELHRLAVAGVGLARNDRRVAALLPVLGRSGEKVPVFARIAERTAALLAASKADAPGEFLQLNTLVGAVLKTQGKTGVDGEMDPLRPSVTTPTQIPMRALSELREGLYHGRTRILDDAIERGWFGDARLAFFALDAFGSDDAALANLAAEKLVPPYGKGIVPVLLESLDLSAKRPAARIIETVGRIDAGSGAALARQILDPEAERVFELAVDGVKISDEAYVAALGLLGDGAADRRVLLDAMNARRKALRSAALYRLLALGDTDAEACVVARLGGTPAKARETMKLLEALPSLPSSAIARAVADRARAVAASLDPVEPDGAAALEMISATTLLAREKPDDERVDAVMTLLGYADVLRRSEARDDCVMALPAWLGYLMNACRDGRREALARVAVKHAPDHVVLAAIRAYGPPDALAFFRLVGHESLDGAFAGLFEDDAGTDPHLGGERLPSPTEWGPEWLEFALETELVELVDHLYPLDPARVVEHVTRGERIQRPAFAMLALGGAPERAAALRTLLADDLPDRRRFVELFDAVADGEWERIVATVRNFPIGYGRRRLSLLRARLERHFFEPAA